MRRRAANAINIDVDGSGIAVVPVTVKFIATSKIIGGSPIV
jgi:hypothetical protein